jgi:hypothetical protein
MMLAHAIEALGSYDSEQTIYVSAHTSVSIESECVVVYETDDGAVPASAAGMQYFLEVHLARDAISVWSRWRGGRLPSLSEKFDAISYYAEHDAFLPTEP